MYLQDANPPLNGSPPPPPDIGGVSEAGSGVEVRSFVSSGGTNAVDDRVFWLSIVVFSVHGTNLVVE